jgi:large subunit ribosomal protein L46
MYAELLPEGFTPSPRETEADKNGNIQTLNRRLKTRVYLSVRRNDDIGWHLPTVVLKDSETFLDGANRAVKYVAGEDLVLRCLSNCPMGVHVLEYNDEEKERNIGLFGEKTFFLRVQYESGDVGRDEMKQMDNWGWLTREEMVEKITAEKGEETAILYKYML